MSIGGRILKLRKETGISQEDLANTIGVSRQAISKWELNQAKPDINYIIKISNFFRVSTDYIIQGRKIDNSLSIINERKPNYVQTNYMFWLGLTLFLIGIISLITFIILSVINPSTYYDVTLGREYRNLIGFLKTYKQTVYFIISCVIGFLGISLSILSIFGEKRQKTK